MAAEVRGIEDMKAKFAGMSLALRKRVLRNALASGARIVRDDAKRNAPVLSAQNMDTPYRKPGTLRAAIRVRTSKAARRAGNVGVFVNVKPAPAGQRGAKSPNDPFYWRFQEFGWRAGKSRRLIAGKKFLTNSAEKLGAALDAFNAALAKYFAKANRGDVK
jgi:HK97 gp10 family phage protein